MFRFLRSLVILIGLLALVAAVFGGWRTYQSEHSPQQEIFANGRGALLGPGFYQGAVNGYSGSWQGKLFYEDNASGINIFNENNVGVPKYPFALSPSAGLKDKNLVVVQLNYAQPDNPWWLKFVVDEIVATGPTSYLGKVHVRITPQLIFTLGYFTLEKI